MHRYLRTRKADLEGQREREKEVREHNLKKLEMETFCKEFHLNQSSGQAEEERGSSTTPGKKKEPPPFPNRKQSEDEVITCLRVRVQCMTGAGRLLTGSQGRGTPLVVKGKLLKLHVAGEFERDPVRWQHR